MLRTACRAAASQLSLELDLAPGSGEELRPVVASLITHVPSSVSVVSASSCMQARHAIVDCWAGKTTLINALASCGLTMQWHME